MAEAVDNIVPATEASSEEVLTKALDRILSEILSVFLGA